MSLINFFNLCYILKNGQNFLFPTIYHTQLYDYKAKEPVLLGGTHSQFSTDDGVTWLPLKGAQELGDIGDIAESVECTTIDDDRKVYCGGLKDSAEKELTIYYYDDDADQQALIAAAEAQQTVRIRHQWPNGTRATYDLKLLGYQIMSGSADSFMQLKVSGRQASDVAWSNADAAEQTQTDEQEGE
jgi:hypothetical protein